MTKCVRAPHYNYEERIPFSPKETHLVLSQQEWKR